jgi:hypothetical protein
LPVFHVKIIRERRIGLGNFKIIRFDYLPTFQNRDSYFENLLKEPNLANRLGSLIIMLNLFSFIYGIVMGSFHSFYQAIAAGVKVAAMFDLAILICFPAFFIIQYVLGSRLRFGQMISIILTGFVLATSIMISFAPIIIFFLLTGSNYYFLQLLHIVVFVISGLFGMKTVIDALKYSCEKQNIYPKVGVTVFKFWVVILAFVGIQLAWNLRPFMGDEGKPFKLFRTYEGNFYAAIIYSFEQLARPEVKDNAVKKSESEAKDNYEIDSTLLELFNNNGG